MVEFVNGLSGVPAQRAAEPADRTRAQMALARAQALAARSGQARPQFEVNSPNPAAFNAQLLSQAAPPAASRAPGVAKAAEKAYAAGQSTQEPAETGGGAPEDLVLVDRVPGFNLLA